MHDIDHLTAANTVASQYDLLNCTFDTMKFDQALAIASINLEKLRPSDRWREQERWWRSISTYCRSLVWRGSIESFSEEHSTALVLQCNALFDELKTKASHSLDMLACAIHMLEVWGLLILTGGIEADDACLRAGSWYIGLHQRYARHAHSNIAEAARGEHSVQHWQVLHSPALDRMWDVFSSALVRAPESQAFCEQLHRLEEEMVSILDRGDDRKGLLEPSPAAAAQVLAKVYACGRSKTHLEAGLRARDLWPKVFSILDRLRGSYSADGISNYRHEPEIRDRSFVLPSQMVEAVLMLVLHLIHIDFAIEKDRTTRIDLDSSPRCQSTSLSTAWTTRRVSAEPDCLFPNEIESSTGSQVPGNAPPVSVKSRLQGVARRLLSEPSDAHTARAAPQPWRSMTMEALTKMADDPKWPAAHLLLSSLAEFLADHTHHTHSFLNSSASIHQLEACTSVGAIMLRAGRPPEHLDNWSGNAYLRTLATTRSHGQGPLSRAVYDLYTHYISWSSRPTGPQCDDRVAPPDEGEKLRRLRAGVRESTVMGVGVIVRTIQRFHVHVNKSVRDKVVESLRQLQLVCGDTVQLPSIDVDKVIISAHDDPAVRESCYPLVKVSYLPEQLPTVIGFALQHYLNNRRYASDVLAWLIKLVESPVPLPEPHRVAIAAACLNSVADDIPSGHHESHITLLARLWTPRPDNHDCLAGHIYQCIEAAKIRTEAALVRFLQTCSRRQDCTAEWKAFMRYVAYTPVAISPAKPDLQRTLFSAVIQADPNLLSESQWRSLFEASLRARNPQLPLCLVRDARSTLERRTRRFSNGHGAAQPSGALGAQATVPATVPTARAWEDRPDASISAAATHLEATTRSTEEMPSNSSDRGDTSAGILAPKPFEQVQPEGRHPPDDLAAQPQRRSTTRNKRMLDGLQTGLNSSRLRRRAKGHLGCRRSKRLAEKRMRAQNPTTSNVAR